MNSRKVAKKVFPKMGHVAHRHTVPPPRYLWCYSKQGRGLFSSFPRPSRERREKEEFKMLAIMPRLRLLVAVIGVSALAALLALAAFSSEADARHSWGKYHWARTTNSFTLTLADNLTTQDWKTRLATASSSATRKDWSESSKLNTRVVSGQKDPATCPPTSGRVEVCNYTYGTNGWLGVAQIWLSGNHIVRGVTKLNDTYFNTARYNTPAWRQLVMCQEVGHTFGLDHQDEIHNNPNLGSCMDYTNDPDGGTGGASSTDPTNEYPNQHDYYHLDQVIYKHLDSTTTVGSTSAVSSMPPAANRGSFNSRAEWGRLVGESPNGKLELWERSFGREARMITWVIQA
jgi:hypothetical protein